MNNHELQKLAEDISISFFGKPFLHQCTFNRRLRTTGGRYMLNSHHIEMNPKHYQIHGRKELISIIKHELCHYHLHIEGKGYQHRDADFKKLLAETGGARHCRPVDEKEKRYKHKYRCSRCGSLFRRVRRIDTAKYVCGGCKGKLKKVS